MKTYTPDEIKTMEGRIDGMDRFDMAALWRRAPSGHPYFRSDLPLFARFETRFNSLGGFNPAISKKIGH